jgi:hypothetical protein
VWGGARGGAQGHSLGGGEVAVVRHLPDLVIDLRLSVRVTGGEMPISAIRPAWSPRELSVRPPAAGPRLAAAGGMVARRVTSPSSIRGLSILQDLRKAFYVPSMKPRALCGDRLVLRHRAPSGTRLSLASSDSRLVGHVHPRPGRQLGMAPILRRLYHAAALVSLTRHLADSRPC